MSSFDKFMYAKQRLEAQRQAEIREQTSGNLPSIVSRPNAGPDQDALFEAKLQMQQFMLILIAYDVVVALFLFSMGQKMEAFQGNHIVEFFIIPAMHKIATVVFYAMYVSYIASLAEAVLHLRQCWYARSITMFRVIDILILLACTYNAVTRPLDAGLRTMCIGRLVRFADVLIMLQQRLTTRLSQNRTAWILEKEKVAVLGNRLDQMEMKWKVEQETKERVEKKLGEYRKEVDTLKEALMVAAQDFAEMEEIAGQQIARRATASAEDSRSLRAAARYAAQQTYARTAARESALPATDEGSEGYDTANSEASTNEVDELINSRREKRSLMFDSLNLLDRSNRSSVRQEDLSEGTKDASKSTSSSARRRNRGPRLSLQADGTTKVLPATGDAGAGPSSGSADGRNSVRTSFL